MLITDCVFVNIHQHVSHLQHFIIITTCPCADGLMETLCCCCCNTLMCVDAGWCGPAQTSSALLSQMSRRRTSKCVCVCVSGCCKGPTDFQTASGLISGWTWRQEQPIRDEDLTLVCSVCKSFIFSLHVKWIYVWYRQSVCCWMNRDVNRINTSTILVVTVLIDTTPGTCCQSSSTFEEMRLKKWKWRILLECSGLQQFEINDEAFEAETFSDWRNVTEAVNRCYSNKHPTFGWRGCRSHDHTCCTYSDTDCKPVVNVSGVICRYLFVEISWSIISRWVWRL